MTFCDKHPCALINGVCPRCSSSQQKTGSIPETDLKELPLKPKANNFSFATEKRKKKKK